MTTLHKPQLKQIARKVYNAVYWLLLFNLIALGWPGRALAISVTGDGDAFFGFSTNTNPRYSYYTNSTNTFGAQTNAANASATINWTRIQSSPTEDLLVAGSLSTAASNNLTIQTSDGNNTNWTAQWSVTDAVTTYQSFDIAFEGSSGDAIVVYSDNTATPKYRTYTASTHTWDSSSSSITVTLTTGTIRWVKLKTNPGTDTIGLAYSSADTSGSNVNSLIWNGSAWGNEPGTAWGTTIMASSINDDFDLGWETSNDALDVVTASLNTTTYPTYIFYRRWTSAGGWSASARIGTTGQDVAQYHIRVAGDPKSTANCIAVASLDNNATTPDLHAYLFNGTTWYLNTNLDTTTYSDNNPHVDLEFAGTTDQAVLLYADASAGTTMTIKYANSCNSAAWTTPSSGTSPTSTSATRFIQAYADPSSSNILFLTSEVTAAGDITAYKYTYAATPTLSSIAETSGSPITTDVSSSTTESFSFAFERLNLVPTLTEILFLALVGCAVFLGVRTGVIKIRKNESIGPKDIKNPPNKNIPPIETLGSDNHQISHIHQGHPSPGQGELRVTKSIDGITNRNPKS